MSQEVDNYVKGLPKTTQKSVEIIRQLVRQAVPDGEEVISYGIPTMKRDGKFVVYYAGYKTHVSIHPIPPGDTKFKAAIKPYVAGKGTLRFALDKALPTPLIRQVIKLSSQFNKQRTQK